jgi:hypothetical protein
MENWFSCCLKVTGYHLFVSPFQIRLKIVILVSEQMVVMDSLSVLGDNYSVCGNVNAILFKACTVKKLSILTLHQCRF